MEDSICVYMHMCKKNKKITEFKTTIENYNLNHLIQEVDELSKKLAVDHPVEAPDDPMAEAKRVIAWGIKPTKAFAQKCIRRIQENNLDATQKQKLENAGKFLNAWIKEHVLIR